MPSLQKIPIVGAAVARPTWLLRLRPFGRKLTRFPGLHFLKPSIRRALAVATPTSHLFFNAHVRRPGRAESQTITILTSNLWHDWPRQRRLHERLEAFAGLVEQEQADVVLLQEVTRTPDLHVDEWLAGRLGYAHVYSRANGHEEAIGFEEGLAILSRFPLSDLHVQQLEPEPFPFVRRLALGATVQTPLGDLLAFSVHLSLLRRMNVAQLGGLQSWVGGLAEGRPVVIGGDFNAHESAPQIRRAGRTWVDTFRHLHPAADGATHVLRWPWGAPLRRQRLDYLFLQPGRPHWGLLDAHHLQTPGRAHSDHRAVLARLLP
ncbi:MAG: endonuclease/exonuclease/phosphatase family protein [Chloroflexota bacterium]